MNTQTSSTPAGTAVRGVRRHWWLTIAALCAFAVGLTIGIWQLHGRNGGAASATTASRSVAAPNAPATSPFVGDGAIDSADTSAVTVPQPAAVPAIPRGGAAEAIDFANAGVAASPALTVYLVATQDAANSTQSALNEAEQLGGMNGAPPRNAMVVVATGDETEAALQSEYPQYRLTVVDLRQP